MDNDYKKNILKQLISSAVGSSAGKSIHETINSIKNAMGAFKGFAKEWDGLKGLTGGQKGGNPMPQMPVPQGQGQKPQMPNLQMPQNLSLPVSPMPQTRPNTPTAPMPNVVRQSSVPGRITQGPI